MPDLSLSVDHLFLLLGKAEAEKFALQQQLTAAQAEMAALKAHLASKDAPTDPPA